MWPATEKFKSMFVFVNEGSREVDSGRAIQIGKRETAEGRKE